MTKNWDAVKEDVYRLYVLQKLSLGSVQEDIKRKHGLEASTRAWRSRLKTWGFERRATQEAMRSANAVDERPVASRPTLFPGRTLPPLPLHRNDSRARAQPTAPAAYERRATEPVALPSSSSTSIAFSPRFIPNPVGAGPSEGKWSGIFQETDDAYCCPYCPEEMLFSAYEYQKHWTTKHSPGVCPECGGKGETSDRPHRHSCPH